MSTNPADAYLLREGITSNLPALDVHHGDIVLRQNQHANATASFWLPEDRKLLARPPHISWPSFPTVDCGMLVLVDIDAGGRATNDMEAGKSGPFLHSMWTHCDKTPFANETEVQLRSNCREVRPYLPPANMRNPANRYLWILFRHACDAQLLLPTEFHWGFKLSFRQLLADNMKSRLAAIARSVMLVGGRTAANKPWQMKKPWQMHHQQPTKWRAASALSAPPQGSRSSPDADHYASEGFFVLPSVLQNAQVLRVGATIMQHLDEHGSRYRLLMDGKTRGGWYIPDFPAEPDLAPKAWRVR